ncbi:uncharacterized protein [Antedon mediterranea]|uniref:uncharacterized protein n=1 Tax=Antedon mediterranea TaxID=105859 RepID=UPI003AF5961A
MAHNPTTLTGYGPSKRLLFNGDETKYELWEVKFLGHLHIQKLSKIIVPESEGGVAAPDEAKNSNAFAELVQYLDDRSLSLIMRDAKNDGRKALGILREHYLGKSKPRIISLYTELTSLKMDEHERVTDYVIRAETAATSLKTAKEQISDSLLVAMVLKGLPQRFRTFATVIMQKEKEINFTDFKIALRSFEESEKAQRETKDDSVMKTQESERIVCFKCGKQGHKSFECRSKQDRGRWCKVCKNKTHDTKFCRKKSNVTAAKSVQLEKDETDGVEFAFKASINSNLCNGNLLVDCGATSHK